MGDGTDVASEADVERMLEIGLWICDGCYLWVIGCVVEVGDRGGIMNVEDGTGVGNGTDVECGRLYGRYRRGRWGMRVKKISFHHQSIVSFLGI